MTQAGPTEDGALTGRAARELLTRAEQLLATAHAVLADHTRAVGAVHTALDPLLDALVRRELAAIPASRLKDVTEGRLRLGAVEQAGFTTVGQVHEANRYELRQIPGVGRVPGGHAERRPGLAGADGRDVDVGDLDRRAAVAERGRQPCGGHVGGIPRNRHHSAHARHASSTSTGD